MSARQRIDVWLFRARLAKTRGEAARLVAEGGVRVVHDGLPRRLEKPSVEIAPGDTLMFPRNGKLLALKVVALGDRRGPPSEARALYSELDAASLA